MTTPARLLNPQESADELGVSLRTLQKLRQRRLIRWVQLTPRKWGMRPDDIAAYHEKQLTGGDGLPAPAPKGKGRPAPTGNVMLFSERFGG
jgi:hypothetical protein